MAVPRYYRVLTGARGVTARQKYLDFLAGAQERALDPEDTGEDRPPSIVLYLSPFGFPLDNTNLLRESALVPSWDHFKDIAPTQTHVNAVLPESKTAINIRSYKAARAIRTQKGLRGTRKKSEITGLIYRSYASRSRSIPFGKAITTDTEAGSAAALLAAYSGPGFAVRFTPERT